MFTFLLLLNLWLVSGAFIAGNKEIIRYLKPIFVHKFSQKSLDDANGNWRFKKRLELFKNKTRNQSKLWENVENYKMVYWTEVFNLGNSNTCVTPVFMQGTPVEATLLVKDLRENFGIFTSVVVYPVIPKGSILLRLIHRFTQMLKLKLLLLLKDSIKSELQASLKQKLKNY